MPTGGSDDISGFESTATWKEDKNNDSIPHLTVIKKSTSTPASEDGYKPGETITYELTVTNDGNVTVTDIVLSDELTGNTGDTAFTVSSLAPGQTSTAFTASYTVTMEDGAAGTVHNEATATGAAENPADPENPIKVTAIPGTTDDTTIEGDEPFVTDDLPIRKEITGDKPSTNATFEFQLKAVSTTVSELKGNMPMPKGSKGQTKIVTIKGAGATEIGTITFTEAGTYVYEMSEVNNCVNGYTYDTGVYTVTYVVTSDENGTELTCVRKITRDGKTAKEVVFRNVYKTPACVPDHSNNSGYPSGYCPPGTNAGSTGGSTGTKAARTGDDNQAMMWFLILFAAMAAAGGAWTVSRRRKKEQQ